MTKATPDFLGMSLDDIQLKAKEIQLEVSLVFKDYRPEYYKCWGKKPIFTKRAIRQRMLNSGALEILLSDFIEYP
jgi:hypothetical protein